MANQGRRLGNLRRSSIVGAAGIFIVLAGGFLAGGGGDFGITARKGSRVAAMAPQPAMPMPADQLHIMEVLGELRDAFRAAPSGSGAAIRTARRDRLCRELPSRAVNNWTGIVTMAPAAGDGPPVLAVRTATGVTLSTWRNAATDAADRTLMPTGTDVFRSAADLKPGARVVFSGVFYPDAEDCLREKNMNVRDSMTQPDFLFRFTAIRRE